METDAPQGADIAGYLLGDEAQFRLEKVRNQLRLLAALACPRSRSDDQAVAIPLSWVQLSHCFDVLADQLESVLDGLDWPARLEAPQAPDADPVAPRPG